MRWLLDHLQSWGKTVWCAWPKGHSHEWVFVWALVTIVTCKGWPKKDVFPESLWQSQDAEIARLLTSNSCSLNCPPKSTIFFLYIVKGWKSEKLKENIAGPVRSKSFPGSKLVVKLQVISTMLCSSFSWINRSQSWLNRRQVTSQHTQTVKGSPARFSLYSLYVCLKNPLNKPSQDRSCHPFALFNLFSALTVLLSQRK